MTNNLERRLWEHEQPNTNRFTTKYKCYYLIYWEHFQYVEAAIAREKVGQGRKKSNSFLNVIRN